jgi:hypothetical protein
MALGIYFAVKGMTPERYDRVIERLEAAGVGAPEGRSYHAAFAAGPGLHVFDVWDSPETFAAFGEVLMPILGDEGVEPGDPMIAEIHNIIER